MRGVELVLLSFCLVALLAGCGAPLAPATAPSSLPTDLIRTPITGATPTAIPETPTADAPTASPAPSATRLPVNIRTLAPVTPASPGGTPMSPIADPLVQQARELLTSQLGVAASSISVKQVEPVEWPDTSLGCPKPGMLYAQVITPGYRIILEANGREYEFHASASRVISCEK